MRRSCLNVIKFKLIRATGVLAKIFAGEISGDDIVHSIITISQVAEGAMGGTSGALYSYVLIASFGWKFRTMLNISLPYSIFFSGLAQGLQDGLPKGGEITPQAWSHALTSALANLYTYTRARPPSRTLVDPLSAFVESFAKANDGFAAAVNAAAKAAEATKDLTAKAGRSAYVEGDRLQKEQIPDPGAWGIKVILENLAA